MLLMIKIASSKQSFFMYFFVCFIFRYVCIFLLLIFFYYRIIWLLDLNLLLLCRLWLLDILDFHTVNLSVFLLYCSYVDCVLWLGFGFFNCYSSFIICSCFLLILFVAINISFCNIQFFCYCNIWFDRACWLSLWY